MGTATVATCLTEASLSTKRKFGRYCEAGLYLVSQFFLIQNILLERVLRQRNLCIFNNAKKSKRRASYSVC